MERYGGFPMRAKASRFSLISLSIAFPSYLRLHPAVNHVHVEIAMQVAYPPG
jgi:hypothetical protein